MHQKTQRPGCVVIVATLCALATTGCAAAAEFRGFWADAFSIGFKNSSQVDALVSRAVAGRYNAVIVEVLAFHDSGSSAHGAYWNSSIVPKAADISGSYDPLADLVTKAHAQGIQVHAWIVPFRACSSWPPSGNATLSAHPEYVMVPLADLGGGPAKIGSYYMLDPGSPGVQEYLVAIVRELVQNYAIDGINLDYIRYTQEDAGYPSNAAYAQSSLARFQTLTGYAGTPAPTGVGSWNDFRRRTITELVRRLRGEIPSITSNPRQPLRLTADLITWGDAPGNFTSTDSYRLFQNWRFWMERGYLDTGIPMNYKREYNTAQAAWYRNWVDAAIDIWSYERQIFCGQGNYLNRKADSVTQLAYCRAAGADGMVNYAYDATADENMDGTTEQDWTWYAYVASNFYTTSDTPPTMPWRDPNTAVEGTLWGRVTDDASGSPWDGADVWINGVDAVETDGNGYYILTMIPASAGGTDYTVQAAASGCDTKLLPNTTVRAGQTLRADITLCDVPLDVGDMDSDGDIDFDDFLLAGVFCMQGPDVFFPDGHLCRDADADGDTDIDMPDFVQFQADFTSG